MLKNFTDLSGRVAVVIGGTSGIGKSMALGFAQAGADVVPTGRRESMVDDVCGLIAAEGRQTLAHPADVADRASIDRFRDAVVAKFGRVDVLLNVAGRIKRTPTKDISEEEWNGIVDTNLTGTLRACQAFCEPLRASGRGRIINIASLNSYVAFFEVDLRRVEVGCLIAYPQPCGEWSRHRDQRERDRAGRVPDRSERRSARRHRARQRAADAHAHGPLWTNRRTGGRGRLLASDAASYITGQCLAVDGGFLASG